MPTQLPLTALLHHIVVTPRRNSAMWIALACLSLGLLLAGSPDALWDPDQRATIPLRDMLAGPLVGLTIGIVSAASSIMTELLFQDQVPFWTAQFWLYFWGTVLAVGAALVAQVTSASPTAAAVEQHKSPLGPYLAVMTVAAASGLAVAAILKQRDNLVKLVGSSLCITTLYISQHLLFPLAEAVESRAIIGIGMLTVSTWAYNFYKDVPATALPPTPMMTTADGSTYSAVDAKGEELMNLQDRGAASPRMVSLEPVPLPAASSVARPTARRLGVCAIIVIVLAAVPPFLPTPRRSIKRDFKAFFTPRHIFPAHWEDSPDVDERQCVLRSFGNEGEIDQHPSLLADWEERIVRSTCPVYAVPDTGLTYHVMWRVDRAETPATGQLGRQLATDAFLATQRLRDGHRLIWWYPSNSSAPPFLPGDAFHSRYLVPESPFFDFVEARPLDVDELAGGTCARTLVEGSLGAKTRAELERTLVLARYGGVWLDEASLLVRDLTPLIRTGPLVPSLVSVVPCPTSNAGSLMLTASISQMDGSMPPPGLLVYGPAWSGLGSHILEHACRLASTSVSPQPLQDLHARCAADSDCGIKPFPAQWATGPTEWETCEVATWPDESAKPLPPRLHGIFAWRAQAHLRTDEDPCWQAGSGSALAAVRMRVEEILDTMPLGLGIDLFPGPGYIDSASDVPRLAYHASRPHG